MRVWGTIGWIVASWPFIFILVNWAAGADVWARSASSSGSATALGTSVKAGLEASMRHEAVHLPGGRASPRCSLAVYVLMLPHTPPKPATGEGTRFATAQGVAKLLKNPFIAVLFVVTFIDAAVHQSFFYWTASFLAEGRRRVVDIPANWVPPVMKIGQIAEILTMLILGYVLKRLGWRTTMVIGVLGHAARFAVFAFFPNRGQRSR